jgi:hypothetical protein
MGVAFATRPYDEATCLRVAHAYQELTGHHLAVPPVVAEDAAGPHPRAGELLARGLVEKPVITATRDDIW